MKAVLWTHLKTRCSRLHPARRRQQCLSPQLAHTAETAAAVDTAMQAVETGFLQIGNILENTAQISHTLVNLSGRLVSFAEGPQGGARVIEDTASHIGRAIEFAESTDRQVEDLINRIEDTHRRILLTLPAQKALVEALSPLKYIQILFRVESATLAPEIQSTFHALNDEISRICERVESGFQEKFAIIARIGSLLHQAGSHLRTRQTQTRGLLEEVRTQLRQSIASSQAVYAQNQERDGKFGVTAQDIKKETSGVVFSLQAQDMLNQKLQQLRTMLREMQAAQDNMPLDKPGAVRSLRFIEQTSQLVTAQLDVMKQELAEAGDSVDGGLRRVLGKMDELKSRMANVKEIQIGEIGYDSPVQNIVEAIEKVTSLISTSCELVSETHRTIDPIRNNSTHFTSFMRDLTLDIHLIGLNAEVHSARVATGTGLEVVSARATETSLLTCRLSESLATEIDAITHDLGEMIASFGNIRSETESFVNLHTEQAKHHTELLHAYRDNVIPVLLEMASQVPQIEAQTRDAMNHADFSGTAVMQLDALHRAVSVLHKAAAEAADAERIQVDTTGMTDKFIKGYTMRSQVDVHQRALQKEAVAAGSETASPVASDSDIELFGFDEPAATTTPAPAVAAAPAAGPVDVDLWLDDPPAAEPAPATQPAIAASTPEVRADENVDLWLEEPAASEPPKNDPRAAA